MRTTTYADIFSVDPRSALVTAALRLHGEFDGVFSLETVERFLEESWQNVIAHATVSRFGPLIAERTARERLRAIAGTELATDHPSVLFLGTRNEGRSQMAAGFLRAMAGDHAVARSAGSHPAESLNPLAVLAMAEIGAPIHDQRPQPMKKKLVKASDVVVTLGCPEPTPLLPGHKYEDWAILRPFGRTIDEVRVTRDEIGFKVGHLVDELGLRVAV
jgi:protein-tyrosine-phosphatase